MNLDILTYFRVLCNGNKILDYATNQIWYPPSMSEYITLVNIGNKPISLFAYFHLKKHACTISLIMLLLYHLIRSMYINPLICPTYQQGRFTIWGCKYEKVYLLAISPCFSWYFFGIRFVAVRKFVKLAGIFLLTDLTKPNWRQRD